MSEIKMKIKLTPGMIYSKYLSLPSNFFPTECTGTVKKDFKGEWFTLNLNGESEVKTFYSLQYNAIRNVRGFSSLITKHQLKAGDTLIITKLDKYNYQLDIEKF